MKIISPSDKNVRPGRSLFAWQPNLNTLKEISWITADLTEKDLGNHSHTYDEPFLLAWGVCTLTTWSKVDNTEKHRLEAPLFFVIPAGEEHLFNALSDDIVLVSYKPKAYEDGDFIPATHLPLLK